MRVSIDTRHAEVAEAAIDAGATLVNDVSASLHEVAAAHGVGWVAMHMQGDPRTMQDDPRYDDVVAEVRDHLVDRAERGPRRRCRRDLDRPGHRLRQDPRRTTCALLAHLDELVATGLAGRRRHEPQGVPRRAAGRVRRRRRACPTDDRLEGSLATATWAMAQGVAHGAGPRRAATVHAAQVVAA